MHLFKILLIGSAAGVGLFCAIHFIQQVRAEMRKIEDENMRRHIRGRYEDERWWSH
jgi:hypothetical protein